MRFARLLPLALLLALPAAAQDAHQRYKEFFYDNVQFRWANAELSSEERVVVLRNFTKHDLPEAADWLMSEVMAKVDEGDVLREAVGVLSGFKSPETLAAMQQIWETKLKKPWETRALGVLAFSKTQQSEGASVIAQALKDKDARLVIAGIAAAKESKRVAMKEEIAKLLLHKHALVRAAALGCLAELRADEMLPQIFRLFATDPSLRVRYDAWLALKKLSLTEMPCDPTVWEAWWQQQAAGEEGGAWGAYPKSKDPSPGAPFFSIPVLGDRIVFVLDISQDMDNPWLIDHKAERDKPKEEQTPNFFSVKTRWQLVVSHLKRCLEVLPDRTEVGLVLFNQNVTCHPENARLLKLSSKTREAIIAHLETNVERSGSTAMYEALQAAWGFLKGGDPEVNFDKGADTIVFVTDGQLLAGELAKRPDRLRAEVWRVAQTRGLRVHVAGIHNHDFDLCRDFSKASGGLYVHVQQHDDTAEPQDLEFWPKKKKAFEEARKKKRG